MDGAGALSIAVPGELRRRRDETARRLETLRGAMRASNLVDDRHPHVTIYATGSLGRHEVGEHSDLDVFIVDAAVDGEERLARLQRIGLLADLIRAGASAGFQPFSRDGEFLQVHRLSALIDHLGRPDEDHLNVFTARMLLVLESHPLMGRSAYEHCVDVVLDRYWAEDEEVHDFRPTILINDIVRYWKTLCLSYEGWRRELGRALGPSERIDLLKLKFNRLWLCFNGLSFLLLGDRDRLFTREHARRLVALTPVERISEISHEAPEVTAQVETVLDHYDWWLARTAEAKEEQLVWIANQREHRAASERAKEFGDEMWRLVNSLGERVGLTRYLLV